MPTVLVGLDIGTSSAKAVAIDRDGEVLKVAERPYAPVSPRPGWSEQDPEEWWRAAEDALDECGGHHCAGIGLSGQMHGLVALDGAQRPLRPAILWNDARAHEQCGAIEERLGLEGFVALTGNRALAGCTAPSLLWVRDHEPELYGEIASIVLPKDYVRLRLTGELATDAVDASGTLLFDVAERSWSAKVLDALELDPDWLPRVYESPAPAGRLGRVPVAAGAGDEAAAAVGAGVVRQGDPVSIVLGTSGVVVAALDGYAADARGRAHSYCHAVPSGWNVLGVTLSAGGSLRWLRDVLDPQVSFRRLILEAEAWDPGTGGLLFAPQLAGERMPHADPRRAAASSASAPTTTAARSPAPCSRASRSACASRCTCSTGSRERPPAHASPAAAHAATRGSRSSPPCSTSRSRSATSRRARPTAPRCSAVSPRDSG